MLSYNAVDYENLKPPVMDSLDVLLAVCIPFSHLNYMHATMSLKTKYISWKLTCLLMYAEEKASKKWSWK